MTAVDVVGLFDAHGHQRYGETVTQLQHALQCAAMARRNRADDELVMAALLHDVGHLFMASEDAETLHHGHRGASLLAPFVPPRVAWLIEYHVVAKRYLCTVDPRYMARLSTMSFHSLTLQGAALPIEQRLALETHRWFADAVRIRRWDDEAKSPDAVTPPLDDYRPLLERWLGPQAATRARVP